MHVSAFLHETRSRGVNLRREGGIIGEVQAPRASGDQDENRARVRVPAGVPAGGNAELHDVSVRVSSGLDHHTVARGLADNVNIV